MVEKTMDLLSLVSETVRERAGRLPRKHEVIGDWRCVGSYQHGIGEGARYLLHFHRVEGHGVVFLVAAEGTGWLEITEAVRTMIEHYFCHDHSLSSLPGDFW